MNKPNLFKTAICDVLVCAIDSLKHNQNVVDYFDSIGMDLPTIDGVALVDGKQRGLLISVKDKETDEIKQVEINLSLKGDPHEEIVQYIPSKELLRVYELENEVQIRKKNGQPIPFETLPYCIDTKINVDEVASRFLDN